MYVYAFPSSLLFSSPPSQQPLRSQKMAASEALDTMQKANFILAIGLVMVFVAARNPIHNPNPSPNPNSVNTTTNCTSSAVMAEKLVFYQVVSFSCFIFSTFIVLSLKLAIDHINVSTTLHFWMFLADVAQVHVFLLLILSVPIGVTIKLGSLTCATSSSFHILAASLSLYILLPIALLFYISLLLYFLTR